METSSGHSQSLAATYPAPHLPVIQQTHNCRTPPVKQNSCLMDDKRIHALCRFVSALCFHANRGQPCAHALQLAKQGMCATVTTTKTAADTTHLQPMHSAARTQKRQLHAA
jgi:hypothetical protein